MAQQCPVQPQVAALLRLRLTPFALCPVRQVLPTQLIPDEKEGKVLRVRFIQKEGKKLFDPVYLFDEGSTISWIPCGRKLTCSFPGIKFYYGPDTYYGEEVRRRCSPYALPTPDSCMARRMRLPVSGTAYLARDLQRLYPPPPRRSTGSTRSLAFL